MGERVFGPSFQSSHLQSIDSRFKGTHTTFAKFPERLRHIVAETTPNVVVESIIFPAYEVRVVGLFFEV